MKKKYIILTAVLLVLIVLFTPVRMNLKDGGSVSYKAIAYEVINIHTIVSAEKGDYYVDGIEVRLFGFTVFRDTNENSNQILAIE